MSKSLLNMEFCPCNSGKTYIECCARFIVNGIPAPSPDDLMRSRYTAYTLSDMDYIKKTMKGKALAQFKNAKHTEKVTWIGLEIIQSSKIGFSGFVEFKAYFLRNHQRQVLHEKSEFIFEDGAWYYVDGILYDTRVKETKFGRNDPCFCGSGKKYKKCCGS